MWKPPCSSAILKTVAEMDIAVSLHCVLCMWLEYLAKHHKQRRDFIGVRMLLRRFLIVSAPLEPDQMKDEGSHLCLSSVPFTGELKTRRGNMTASG